ncbi:MAG: DUF5652 family protein [Minisyncoccia bacterium]
MQLYPMFYSPFAPTILAALVPIIFLAAIWTVVLKGFALWHAARGSQKWWFIALLVVNTLGILEIIYLVWFRPGAIAKRRMHKSSAAAE